MNPHHVAEQPPRVDWLEAPELDHLTEAFGSHLDELRQMAAGLMGHLSCRT